LKRNQVFSTVLAFLLIASVVNIVFGYKILHGEDIYGDMDVWLNTENNTAYQTRELGSPIYCENPNPCEDVRHFDCSGLVYFVFQYSLGIRAELGRLGASDYYSECFTVGENIADANVGDLLFSWSNEEGDIVHVGIVTERPSSTSFKVVHASGGRHSVVEDNRGIPNSFWTDWGDFAGNITRTQIVASARAQIGAHYLWGAEGDIPLWWEIVGN
jgi:cell wall-associated NlpC family hydrolase